MTAAVQQASSGEALVCWSTLRLSSSALLRSLVQTRYHASSLRSAVQHKNERKGRLSIKQYRPVSADYYSRAGRGQRGRRLYYYDDRRKYLEVFLLTAD